MNDIKALFFHLTPETLAAIVVDLNDQTGTVGMWRRLAEMAGYDNCGDEFVDMVEATKAQRDESEHGYYEAILWDEATDDQRDEDEIGYADTVAEGLERWTR